MTGTPPPIKYAVAAGLGLLAIVVWLAVWMALDSASLRHGLHICQSDLCSLCAAKRTQRFVDTGEKRAPKGLR